tara:strand:- start:14370 stop:14747 length:378 start_codon:yes stop_codon:yes gene_type:complete
MKTTLLKKLIKEAVKEAIQEELKEVLLEAVRAPKINTVASNPIVENKDITSTTPPPVTSKPVTQHSLIEKKQKYMDVIGETALNLNSSHAQTFNPRGTIDTTSPNGQLPAGEVGMDQIMGLMTNK